MSSFRTRRQLILSRTVSTKICILALAWSAGLAKPLNNSLSLTAKDSSIQASEIRIPLTWTVVSPDDGKQGFALSAFALNSKTPITLALNISSPISYMGAKKINGLGSNDWGIPDCNGTNGCSPDGTEENVSIYDKDYPVRGATMTFGFPDLVGESNSDRKNNFGKGKSMLRDRIDHLSAPKSLQEDHIIFSLLNKTRLTDSPSVENIAINGSGGLGFGPRSPFLRSWTKGANPEAKYSHFSITFKPDSRPLRVVLNRPNGAFLGSYLSLYTNTPLSLPKFRLYDLPRRYGLAASLSLKNTKKGTNVTNGIRTGSIGCVYPDGFFFFALKNVTSLKSMKKRIFEDICGSETGCSSSHSLAKAPLIYLELHSAPEAAKVAEKTVTINRYSYLVKQNRAIRVQLSQADELFVEGGPCEGADFALGGLFFYEFKVDYYSDLDDGNGFFDITRMNFIGGHHPPAPPAPSTGPGPSPTPTPSRPSNSGDGSSFFAILMVISAIFVAIVIVVSAVVYFAPKKSKPGHSRPGSRIESMGDIETSDQESSPSKG